MRWPSHISAEDCQYVLAFVDIDFFVHFVSWAEIVASFLSKKDPKLIPSVQRYIHHSTLRKYCNFHKNRGAHFFLFIQCSKNAGVDVSIVVNRRKAVCEQIQRERLSFSLRKQDRAHITLVSLLVQPNVAAIIDQHLQFRPSF